MADIESGSEMRALLDKVGGAVAERARGLAPKLSGAGAASIDHEVVEAGGRMSVRVSWGADQFHMEFQELGTSRMPANPFLRPALDGPVSI